MWRVIGQDRALEQLKRSLKAGNIGHAYLFTGPPQIGKMALALDLARALNCSEAQSPCGQCLSCQKIDPESLRHSDIQIITLADAEEKTKTEIGIDQIRQVQRSASLPPYEGRCRIFIIDGAEKLSTEAANCLLKTLEEPEEHVVFVLLAAGEELLPETVVSRCTRLKLRPVPLETAEKALLEKFEVEAETASLLARLSRGRLGWAIQAAADDSLLEKRSERLKNLMDALEGGYEERFDYVATLAKKFTQKRQEVLEVFSIWLDFWRDLMLVKLGQKDAVSNIDLEPELEKWAGRLTLKEIRGFISAILKTERALKLNANPRLALEVMMLDIPRGKEVTRASYG